MDRRATSRVRFPHLVTSDAPDTLNLRGSNTIMKVLPNICATCTVWRVFTPNCVPLTCSNAAKVLESVAATLSDRLTPLSLPFSKDPAILWPSFGLFRSIPSEYYATAHEHRPELNRIALGHIHDTRPALVHILPVFRRHIFHPFAKHRLR